MLNSVARLIGAAVLIAIGAGCCGSETEPGADSDSDEELYTNTYIVPPNFLTSGPDDGSAARDPFAPPDPDDPFAGSKNAPVRRTAKEVLEAYGVEFPPGSAVPYGPGSSTLIVRNTEKNLELVDAVIRSLVAGADLSLRFRLDILEADGAMLQKLVTQHEKASDHSAAFDEVMSLSAGRKAEIVTSLLLEARSGQRGQVVSGSEVSHVVDYHKEEGEWLPSWESREVGTIFEVDPVLGPDDETVDLNFSLEHHFAPPAVRKVVRKITGGDPLDYDLTEFYYARISTQLTLAAGTTRILGLMKPPEKIAPEKPGRFQIAFLHVEVFPIVQAEPIFSEKRDLPPRE